jgi:DNA-binding MarR family transcriptional regulator
MVTQNPEGLVTDFLGSAQVFITTINDLLEAELRRVTGGRVTIAQLKLLKMVSMASDYTVSDVAGFLGVSTAAASRGVDRLVRRQLLARREGTSDRRLVELSLTEEGTRILGQYDVAAEAVLREVFGTFSGETLERTGEVLDRLSLSVLERGDDGREYCFRCGIHFRDRCILRSGREHECFFHTHRRRHRNGSGVSEGKTGK